MSSSSFEYFVQRYLNEFKEISNISDEDFLNNCKQLILELFECVKPEEVKGIVVGIIFNEDLPKKKGGYFISSGRSKLTDCEERNFVLNELKNLYLEKKGIIFIRFPFLASDNDRQFDMLANAFEPLFRHLLNKIVDGKNSRGVYTPILTLGYRAAKTTYDCLETTSRPQFIVLPTVHPNFFAEMLFEISQCGYDEEQKKLQHIKVELVKFTDIFKKFKNLCN